MIGGPPMMMQPQYIPQQAPQAYQPPRNGGGQGGGWAGQPQMQAAQPQPWPPPRVQAQPQPQFQAPPMTAQQPMAPITPRGMRPDEPPAPVFQAVIENVKMAPVRLPAPEDLGIGLAPQAATARIDWNAAHERFRQLGGLSLQTAQLADGRVRITLLLRTNQADRLQHLEATATSEAEAVIAAFGQAERWASGQTPTLPSP